MSNIQPCVCAPDTGLVVKQASLQSWDSIPVTPFPCQLCQGAITRSGNQVLEERFRSLLSLAMLRTSLPNEEKVVRVIGHLGASVNFHFLYQSYCSLLGWFPCPGSPGLWLSVQNKGGEVSGCITKAYSVDWTFCFVRLMTQSESYCSSHTEIPFCYSYALHT